jgi:hypothetical protein
LGACFGKGMIGAVINQPDLARAFRREVTRLQQGVDAATVRLKDLKARFTEDDRGPVVFELSKKVTNDSENNHDRDIKNIIIVQNKIDIVDEKRAMSSYKNWRLFTRDFSRRPFR